MKPSIIVPAFSEERTIAALLNTVSDVDLGSLGLEREILVVSHSSTDAPGGAA